MKRHPILVLLMVTVASLLVTTGVSEGGEPGGPGTCRPSLAPCSSDADCGGNVCFFFPTFSCDPANLFSCFGGAVGPCVLDACVLPFPPAGTDEFPTSISFLSEDPDGNPLVLVAEGPILIDRGDPFIGPHALGVTQIETEIVSMELTGQSKLGPVRIRAGQSFGLPPSLGKTLGGMPGFDFPANSFFDVFFDIEVAGFTLCNTEPQQVRATINEIPPLNPPDFSFGSDLLSIPLAPCDNGPEAAHPLVANLMAFHCTPEFSGLPPGTDECCVSAVTTYNNGGPFGRPPPAIQLDPDVVCFPCDPDPRTQGYWHRQCLGVPGSEGGIDPGRNGRGPQAPIEPDFAKVLMPAVDALLQADLFLFGSCSEGMDADPASDPCERAIKQYTALLFNIESDRLQSGCGVDVSAQGCVSTTVGDLVNELANLIIGGNCQQAADCADAVNEGFALESVSVASTTEPSTAPLTTTISGSALGGAAMPNAVEIAEPTAEPVSSPAASIPMLLSGGSDVVEHPSSDQEAAEEEEEDPLRAIERHLMILANSSSLQEDLGASTDALLTALSGGYEPEFRLQIVKGLLGQVDVAYESLLAEHLRDIRDEAMDFENEIIAKEAEKLLKRLEPAEQ